MSAHEPTPPRSRWLAAGEFLIGTVVVVGHNVFRVVPNEVPILVALWVLTSRLWAGRWRLPGFDRPKVLWRTVLIGVAAAALRLAAGEFVIEPLATQFWPPPQLPEMASGIPGNAGAAVLAVLYVWVAAAFGEEIAYRGYLLPRASAALGGSTVAQWLGVIASAVLFGVGHYYKGPAGMIDSGVAGLILGAAYLLTGRNLWAGVLAHGLIDTLGVVLLYFGGAG